MEFTGGPHATAVGVADYALRAVLSPGFIVRARMPIAPGEEPDLAVVSVRRADCQLAHPTRPVLVVEVADSSLQFDRQEKGSLHGSSAR